jgi:hypothetical protein
VVTAGFSELVPKDEDVYFRWLDTWRAYWQKDSAKTTAKWDLLATRIRNAARIQAQKDMVFYLSDILRSPIPREALALRVLQTLEAVGADPATRKNLSPEVVSMLKTLHDWMIPK